MVFKHIDGDQLATLEVSRVHIPGTTNVRDLGGFQAAADRHIQPGRFYRGEALARPGPGVARVALWNENSIDSYQALGLRTVIDLRGENETRVAPSAWGESSRAVLHSIPIDEGGEGDNTDYVRQLKAGELRTFSPDDLADYYARTVRTSARQFGEAVGVLASPGSAPALVHCAAGKDRTGLLVALVLETLGTPRELVVADYAYTGVLRPNRVAAYADVLAAVGVEATAVKALFETPAAAMERLLDGLDAEFGSVREFLLTRGEIEEAKLDGLAEQLLEPAD